MYKPHAVPWTQVSRTNASVSIRRRGYTKRSHVKYYQIVFLKKEKYKHIHIDENEMKALFGSTRYIYRKKANAEIV
mgnify:CR=1 FL=1